jgi:hypothetical protein
MTRTTTTTFRVTPAEKAHIQNFVSQFSAIGGQAGGKTPTVSNMTTLLWMMVCGREVAITDPVNRSNLGESLLVLRNLGTNLNGLMAAYHQGLVFEKFDGGDEFLSELRSSVLALKSDIEAIVRNANGNRQALFDGLAESTVTT